MGSATFGGGYGYIAPNKRDIVRERINSLPWSLDYTSKPHVNSYDADEPICLVTYCYSERKENYGYFGEIIPHTAVIYKYGVPAVVELYDPEKGQKKLKEARRNGYNLHYNDYEPEAVYNLMDNDFWSAFAGPDTQEILVDKIKEIENDKNAIVVKRKNIFDDISMFLNDLTHKNGKPVLIKKSKVKNETIEYRY